MPKTPDDLFQMLSDLAIDVTTVAHPPLFTVEDSQALRGQIAGGHTKNLFVKDKKDRFFLITVEETASVDLKQIHRLIGASSRVSFGNAERLMDCLGVVPGAVTAFGAINDVSQQVTIVLDAALMEYEIINAHPLINTATTSIRAKDLVEFLRATGHEPLILNVTAASPH